MAISAAMSTSALAEVTKFTPIFETAGESDFSTNGRYIAWERTGGLALAIKNSIFLLDRLTGEQKEILSGSVTRDTRHASRSWDLSGDAKYLTFSSTSDDVVDGDSNGEEDVFLLEISTGEITRISIGFSGYEAEGRSRLPSISTTGKYVTYYSNADNIVENDPITGKGTFVYNIDTGETTLTDNRIGLDDRWISNPNISADGKYILSDNIGENPLSLANTEDGTRTSLYSNEGLTNNYVTSTMSSDGRFVLWAKTHHSYDLTNLYFYDRKVGNTSTISISTDGSNTALELKKHNYDMSGDGRFIVFATDQNGITADDNDDNVDIFVFDRVEQETVRVNEDTDGARAGVGIHISEDGHYISFGEYITSNPLFGAEFCEGYEVY